MRRFSFFFLSIALSVHAHEPELVGVGTITTSGNELNSAFTPEGRTMYFTRTAGGANDHVGTIVVSHRSRKGWSTPEVAEFSGHHSDYDPFVSPDSSRLFFISKRPLKGNEPKSDFDIWVVDRTSRGWSTPRNVGTPVNSDNDELYPAIASDGTLYYSSCGRADSFGRCDLYRSRLRDGEYQTPENLGSAINTSASETDAYIAPDQSYLVFAAYSRADAIGDGDLYISNFRDAAWSKPRSLGPKINTIAREYCPIVSPDGKYFYFTRQHGDSQKNGNVYRVPIAALGAMR
ncbi:MAG TPA: hypothetical protein VGQ76_22365 [Thermoanaerobaculia bacterium]|jgi:Tol biopolymer transport system component|nr:hypothetical protein [Thermoanaerobaculia bacterium]